MGALIQDLRYGLRMLARNPGFTAVAVLSLALGIGANTAIFSVVNAALLRPLPFKDPERLVVVWENNRKKGWDRHRVEGNRLLGWEKQNRVFNEMAASSTFDLNLSGTGEPERVRVAEVTSNFFSVHGAQPVMGRTFLPTEAPQMGERVVILSYGLWERQFGSDPNILGRALTLDGERATVVGVMPAWFPGEEQAWLPLRLKTSTDYLVAHGLFVLARLKPGVTLGQAQADMTNIARHLEQQFPDTDTDWGVTVRSLHDEMVREVRPAFLLLCGAVALVLLIACANVANLLLARALARKKELAIRAALGAGQARLIQQLLVESLLIALLSGALGCLLSIWGTAFLVALDPGNVARFGGVHLDVKVLGFTVIASLLAGVMFGSPPAAYASTPDLNESLKEGGTRLSGSVSGAKMRRLLVVCEVILTVAVVVGAGLLTRSFLRVLNVKLGLNSTNVLTMRFSLPWSRYGRSHERVAFYHQLLERVETLPGVRSAAMVSDLPLSGRDQTFRFVIEGRMPALFAEHLTTEIRWVSANYFSVMGIPLKTGRSFTEKDNGLAAGVVIINESMARQFWPTEDPVNKRISIDWESGRWLSIAGVVGDVKEFGLEAEPKPELYVPYSQGPSPWMSLAVRTSSDPMSMLPAVKSQIRGLDKDLPPFDIKTMDQRLADSLSRRRFSMILLGLFAATALTLAAVGIYGVISDGVTQRTHEIGVRMALGAQRHDVLWMVLQETIVLVLVGMAIGLPCALVASRLVSSMLFGVKPDDPVTIVLATSVIFVVGLFAAYLPARRATKVDPMTALRYE